MMQSALRRSGDNRQSEKSELASSISTFELVKPARRELPRRTIPAPVVGGLPSAAWLEKVLAAERACLARWLEGRHRQLLSELQAESPGADGGEAASPQVLLELPDEAGAAIRAGTPPGGESHEHPDHDTDPEPGQRSPEDRQPLRPPFTVPPRDDGLPAPSKGSGTPLPGAVLPAEPSELPASLSAGECGAVAGAEAPPGSKRRAWGEPAATRAGAAQEAVADALQVCTLRSLTSVDSELNADPGAAIDRPESCESYATTSSTTNLKRELSFAGEDSVKEDGCICSKVVKDPRFEILVACLIMANAVVMACQMQYDGMDLGHELQYRWYSAPAEETWRGGQVGMEVMDYLFGAVFTTELILKVMGWRAQWFNDPWNFLDLVIVGGWVVEKPFQVIRLLPSDPAIIRLARFFRLLRLLKVMRTLHGADPLYLLLTTLKGSVWILSWSCALLMVVQMMTAMFLWFALKELYFDNAAYPLQDRRDVFEYFGTFTRALLSTVEMTLANWPPVCRLLVENVSEWFSMVCILHKLTMGFAVIGVVNGVLMQETFKVAATDDRLMVRQREREVKVHTKKLNRLFRAADESGDGIIDMEEFTKILQEKEILSWLSSMEITVRDPEDLYTLLDKDGDRQLTREELVRGALALRGSAKTVDLLEMRVQMGKLLKALALDRPSLGPPLAHSGSVPGVQ